MAPKKNPENWAGAFKAIGLRALTAGKFWQFCFLGILVALIWRIESRDWVQITELFLKTYWFSWLGWGLWVSTVVGAVAFYRMARARYKAEIDRLVEHRNELQGMLTKQPFQSSKLVSK